MNIKYIVQGHLGLLVSTALLATGCRHVEVAPERVEFNGAAPLEWSVRMADAEIARRGDSLAWAEGRRSKWTYTSGLLTLSVLELNEWAPTPAYVQFCTNTIGSFITPEGVIHKYKRGDFNIDHINPGKSAIALWQLTGEERYREAAAVLRDQLTEHPRTSEGGFWHKQRYPSQMWLDGLYMGAPFYAQYATLFGDADDYDDVVRQFRLMDRHAYDPESGLYYHGWDEAKNPEWANPVTGTSSNFWGRGLGWFSMALVDVLEFIPDDHAGRLEIIEILNRVCEGIVRHQDVESGLWWQVLDHGGRDGNYLEATASSMFVYSMAKGMNRGYLSSDYRTPTIRGYAGIIDRLIREDANGGISLMSCCSVAGLGYGRDGSYAYYLREAIVDNDPKGVGPFILAGIELQRLLGLPMSLAVTATAGAEDGSAASVAPEWADVPSILARITPPIIPSREFRITDFGLLQAGCPDASVAIRRAIDACADAGGGRVVVPAGEYLTGPIRLKSNIELHLEGGATLRFKTDPSAYLPAVFTRFEGMECYNYSPLIYAFEQENIAITGSGLLDGQASDSNWWPMKGKQGGTNTQKRARARLMQQVADGVPVDQRRFGTGDFLRPSFIQPYRCRNVLIEGVRIRRSPMWEVHPVLCTNVIVRGLNIVTHGPNNDGCNPESSRDVLIENCLFDTGDDCIAIKSGRNNDGRRVGVPSENIIVRGCRMKDGHGGVVMGSEISGGVRNVFIEDCEMDSPNLDRALRFKSNAVRGGVIENVFMRRVAIGKVSDAVLRINFLYEEGANGPFKPVVRNVVMEDVTVQQTPRVLRVEGFPGAMVEDVRIHNSSFYNVQKEDVIRDAEGVELVDCVVKPAPK
jgi:unsaturated rhamnogalacturonyl hydrolase